MSDMMSVFFGTWSLSDAEARRAVLGDCLSDDVTYADPRAPGVLAGIDAVNGYLNAFSEMAPGMEAGVVATSDTQGAFRATVSFGMPGSDQSQRGQYFVELAESGKIARMVGFAGMGEPA